MDNESIHASIRTILQPAAPTPAGLDVAAATLPAEKLSGDFFDCIPVSNDGLVVAVGDVSGYGVDAALNAVRTQAYLRALATHEADPAEILTRVNRLWAEHRLNHRFATLFCARIDGLTRRLVHAGAGHVGYRWSRRDGVTPLVSTACPVGIKRTSAIPSGGTTPLLPGDVVFVVSNGVRQAVSPHGSTFGANRVFEIIDAHHQQPAGAILQALHEAVSDFQKQPRRDDMTTVVVKLQP